MTSKKKIVLSVVAGVWVSAITVMTVKNTIDTRFTLNTIITFLENYVQDQYDKEFVDIVSDLDLDQPPSSN